MLFEKRLLYSSWSKQSLAEIWKSMEIRLIFVGFFQVSSDLLKATMTIAPKWESNPQPLDWDPHHFCQPLEPQGYVPNMIENIQKLLTQ